MTDTTPFADESTELTETDAESHMHGYLSTRDTELDQKLHWAWERKRADHDYAYQFRSDPTDYDDKDRPVFTPPEWGLDDMAEGPSGTNPEYDPDKIDDTALRAALGRFHTLITEDFDYRNPASGTTEQERDLVDAYLEGVLETCDQLTENQRQAMIDWGHWQPKLRFDNEMKKAVNIEAQQALNTMLFLAGYREGFPSHVKRRQKINRLMSDEDLEAAYQMILAEAIEDGSVEEARETLKWEGVLDENGHPREEPLPDRTDQRNGNEAYHPVVHAEWTGWKPGDGGWWERPEAPDPVEDVYTPGFFGGDLWLHPPGELHPQQEPDEIFDPFNPPPISSYVGTPAIKVPITEDSIGFEIGLQAIGMALRYDKRSASLEFTYNDPRGVDWARVDDITEGAIWDAISRLCVFERGGEATVPARFKGQIRTDSRNTLQHNIQMDAFHADYLELVAPWDGQERMDNILNVLFKLNLTEPGSDLLARAAARSILLGAVMRSYEPGAKLDEIAVLIGPQGCGKSLFCSLLVPSHRRDLWFSDELVLRSSGQHRDQAQALLGRVIVECGEMAGLSRADVDGLKAFIARQTDHIRLPYDRLVSDHPRRCVIIGTSNDDQILPNDPTGLRRFLPVRIRGRGDMNIVDAMDRLRDQLWAEARERYMNGELPIIDEETRMAQESLVQVYRRADEIVEVIVSEYVVNLKEVTLQDVVSIVSEKTETLKLQGLEGRVKYALRERGFTPTGRQVVKGVHRRTWVKQEPEPEDEPTLTAAAEIENF